MPSKDKCKRCNGSGLTNRKPLKCSCKSICTKCENNEGFKIHPSEICDYCCGTGCLKQAKLVLCI